MIIVELLVLRGAMASCVSISFDVLETANRLLAVQGRPPAFRMTLAGSGAADWRRLAPAAQPATDGHPDIVVVPGLGLTSQTAIDEGLRTKGALQARRRLIEHAEAGADIAAACSATFLVASTGLLDGRRATTTWWLAPLFRGMFPAIRVDPDAVLVSDGPFTTAGAAMAQLDLMLSIVARFAGSALADLCARYLLLDGRRSQLPYSTVSLLAATDERVARAEGWARDRLEEGVDVEQLAAAAGLTSRTFARRVERVTGLSPVRFLQRLRIERATDLAASTRLSFDEIARRVGYAEPSTLRRLMRREGRMQKVARPARYEGASK
jgi:transcriptional regulator GlxA family with amidase domain